MALLEQPKSPEFDTARTCKESSTKEKVAAHFSEPKHSGPCSAALKAWKSEATLEEDETSESSIDMSLHDSSETDSEESEVE